MKTFDELADQYEEAFEEAKKALPLASRYPYERIKIPVKLPLQAAFSSDTIEEPRQNMIIFEFEKAGFYSWLLVK